MKRLLLFVCGSLFAGALFAQINTTSATAANLQWGQHVDSLFNSATPTQFWYTNIVVGGRSYCVETGQFEGTYGDQKLDPVLTIFHADATTQIVQNDDLANEPRADAHARACFIATSDELVFTEITPAAGGTANGKVELRFTETTLFCPWYFISGDYNAFSLIRNSSKTALNGVVITWRGLSGAVAGTTTVSIPANGTVVVNARDFVSSVTFPNGSVEIAHTGSLDQLAGSTTTLSGTTGLGFDAQFTQRRPW